jgi:TldD protein
MDDRLSSPFDPSGRYAVDVAIAQELLTAALARGGDYADLFFEYAIGGSYGFEDGILRSSSRSLALGLGVRVMKGDATGYAFTEDLDLDAMKRTASIAGQIAVSGRSHAPISLTRGEPARRYSVPVPTLAHPGERKRELLQRADRAARAADPRVVRVDASLTEELREVVIATSDGRFVRDRQPLVRFGVHVLVESDGARQSGSSGGGGRFGLEYFDSHSPEDHAREAVRQAVAMLDAREAPAGPMEVVLAAGDSGILLHEAVGHGLEADFNRKGTSHYSGRVGERVASELCTVVDDATVAGSRGSINVDDEGRVPSRATLIDRGTLAGYMQDRHSAVHFGVEPTGNARREDFRSAPMPRMTNTYLLAGESEPEDIVRSVKRGVFAKKFGGGQVDIGNGDFVFNVTEGYLIEDGAITAPLKGVNLIGNGPDVMRDVVMVGSDFEASDGIWTCGKDGQSVPVGVGCPTLKIRSITVGGTQLGGRSS